MFKLLNLHAPFPLGIVFLNYKTLSFYNSLDYSCYDNYNNDYIHCQRTHFHNSGLCFYWSLNAMPQPFKSAATNYLP